MRAPIRGRGYPPPNPSNGGTGSREGSLTLWGDESPWPRSTVRALHRVQERTRPCGNDGDCGPDGAGRGRRRTWRREQCWARRQVQRPLGNDEARRRVEGQRALGQRRARRRRPAGAADGARHPAGGRRRPGGELAARARARARATSFPTRCSRRRRRTRTSTFRVIVQGDAGQDADEVAHEVADLGPADSGSPTRRRPTPPQEGADADDRCRQGREGRRTPTRRRPTRPRRRARRRHRQAADVSGAQTPRRRREEGRRRRQGRAGRRHGEGRRRQRRRRDARPGDSTSRHDPRPADHRPVRLDLRRRRRADRRADRELAATATSSLSITPDAPVVSSGDSEVVVDAGVADATGAVATGRRQGSGRPGATCRRSRSSTPASRTAPTSTAALARVGQPRARCRTTRPATAAATARSSPASPPASRRALHRHRARREARLDRRPRRQRHGPDERRDPRPASGSSTTRRSTTSGSRTSRCTRRSRRRSTSTRSTRPSSSSGSTASSSSRRPATTAPTAGPSGVLYSPANDPFVITVGAADLGTQARREGRQRRAVVGLGLRRWTAS